MRLTWVAGAPDEVRGFGERVGSVRVAGGAGGPKGFAWAAAGLTWMKGSFLHVRWKKEPFIKHQVRRAGAVAR